MRRGLTLLELLAVLVILGVLFAIVPVTRHDRHNSTAPDSSQAIRAARHNAIATRSAVTTDVSFSGIVHSVTAFPDGSVLADTTLRLDRLSGSSIP